MKLHIPVALVLLTVLVAGPALSQDADVRTTDTDAGYIYDFPDGDSLVGDTGAGTDFLRGRPNRAGTELLLRPRGSFVPEMLKSVESM